MEPRLHRWRDDGGFDWAGAQTDPETGFSYLRSRYYSPGVGRTLTPDVLSQSGAGTQGFNRYAYAGNNPVTFADPSGHAAGLAGLGQTIAGVFGYIAAVLDCYLQGECRYRRHHGGEADGAVGSRFGTEGAGQLTSWSGSSLALARILWPEAPKPKPSPNSKSLLQTLGELHRGGPSGRWMRSSQGLETWYEDPVDTPELGCIGSSGFGPHGYYWADPEPRYWFYTIFLDTCEVEEFFLATLESDPTDRLARLIMPGRPRRGRFPQPSLPRIIVGGIVGWIGAADERFGRRVYEVGQSSGAVLYHEEFAARESMNPAVISQNDWPFADPCGDYGTAVICLGGSGAGGGNVR